MVRAGGDKQGPVDTSEGVTHQSGKGWEIFVVSTTNEVHMASHKVGKYHHSSLLAGNDVAMAGEVRVENGRIKELTGKSGHYRPTRQNLVQFLHWLEKDGVPLDFDVHLGPEPGVVASDYVRGMDHLGTVRVGEGYEGAKTDTVLDWFREKHGRPKVNAALALAGWKVIGGKIKVEATGAEPPLKDIRQHLKKHFGVKAQQKTTQDKGNEQHTIMTDWK